MVRSSRRIAVFIVVLLCLAVALRAAGADRDKDGLRDGFEQVRALR